MDAGEDVRTVADVPRHERDVGAPVHDALVRDRAELAVQGRDVRLRNLRDEHLVLPAICDQVGDRDQLQAVRASEDRQIREPRHRAVLVDRLAQHPRRIEPCEAREIHGGFGMSGPFQDAAIAVAQREDVART